MRPPDPYFAKPGISSHMLADFRKSPRFFYQKHIQKKFPNEAKPAYTFGHAVHCLVLEGKEKYAERFVVAPPEHCTPTGLLSTKKEAEAWVKEQTKDVLTAAQDDHIRQIAQAVLLHPVAADLLSHGRPEIEILSSLDGVPIKAKLDWVIESPERIIVDLKTCANLDDFAQDAQDYGYINQMAWYELMHASAGLGIAKSLIIAVEKSDSMRVAVYQFSDLQMQLAHKHNELAFSNYLSCSHSDEWPITLEPGIRTL